MPEKKSFYGWRLVAVLFLIDFINMGFPYYGGTIINSYMIHAIQMKRSTLGLGFTILNLFVGLAALVVAVTIVKWGIRKTFMIGSAIVGINALFLGFFASKPWHYLVAFGAVNGAGMSFATLVPCATGVTRWFRRYRGAMMGLTLSASGISGFVLSPLLDKLLRAGGGNWHFGWRIVACAMVLSGLIAFLFVRESPESMGQTVDGLPEQQQAQPSRTDTLATKHEWTAAQAYGTPAYWLVAIAGIAATFPYFLFIAHWVEHLTGVGITPANASWGISLLTLGTLGGRWLGGFLMDYLNARLVFVLGASLYFISSYLAFTSNAEALKLAYVASAVQGIAYGWTYSCTNTMIGHYYGPKAYPKLSGMFIFLTSAIASPAGLVGGMIFDRYGSYVKSFQLDAVLAAIGIVAVLFAAMPTPREKVPVLVGETGVASAS
ncbi:MAG TPA: MFS transporter [Candidatus Acidoferrales bacterium]|nr:MFS transporter [Candidatus Acidoferrales bacterium]